MTMTEPKENDDEIMNNIQIYSSDEEQLKFLGQILSNETSRKILQVLFDNELTASEISFETGVSLPLINHHVNTMLQSKIVTISKTTMNSKNQPMKHYIAKSSIVILPKKILQNPKKVKYLSVTLKTILKFTSIGLAGIVFWFLTNSLQNSNQWQSGEESLGIFSQELISIIIGLSVVGIGLLVQYWFNKKRNRKIRI